MALIVQKYGGASLLNNEKLKAVARNILKLKNDGNNLVIVVSAMGRETDHIISAIKDLSHRPEPREVDLALSIGETQSAALLCIALVDIGCAAISLTGTQAGILTSNVHLSANVLSIDEGRIRSELGFGKVVVIPGFQGVTRMGDITTLGRGGSDTTAVSIAASLHADRCEILKEVPGIFSANPNQVPDAHLIPNLNYESLLEMTFWGAKVLNYRAAEIASFYSVPLYVGPANATGQGTYIKDEPMIETSEVISLNSHEKVFKLKVANSNMANALSGLRLFLSQQKISFPQILHAETYDGSTSIYLTGSQDILESIQFHTSDFLLDLGIYSSITATCRGTTHADLLEAIARILEREGIAISNAIVSSSSVSIFIDSSQLTKSLHVLHKLIKRPLVERIP